jgi:hypothetical protein
MKERKHAAYFAMRREMDHEQDKDKREEERAQKCEKARRAKEAYARGGETRSLRASGHLLLKSDKLFGSLRDI